MTNFVDRTGIKYGRLTALSVFPSDKPNKRWLCRCDCGTECIVIGSKLASGHTKSCGCYKSEVNSAKSKIHGTSNTPTFNVWQHMHRRCNDQKNQAFKNYGGRGIKVCERWSKFENFFADMGEKPEGMSIDRIDNNKGYSPDNCRWATKEEQANNTRWNVFLETPDGERLTLSQFCKKTGKNYEAVKSKRLRKGVIDGAVEVMS